MRKLFWGFLLSIVFFASVITVSAHSGGTDSSGGHHVNGTSEYHYHHGETAHNHYDMDMDGDPDCPIRYIENIRDNPNNSKYSYLDLSDYKIGYLSGFDDGYKSGNSSGYDSGYSDGKKETEQIMSTAIKRERKDAAKNAYFVCLLYGFPSVAFITSTINAKINKKKDSRNQNTDHVSLKNINSIRASASANNIPNTKKEHFNNSSFIQNMEYKNNTLILTFKTGSTYKYYNVPESIYKDMITAKSKGRFFNERIKDKYPYS